MRPRPTCLASLLLAGLLGTLPVHAHGGAYRGPGEVVPPGGSGSGAPSPGADAPGATPRAPTTAPALPPTGGAPSTTTGAAGPAAASSATDLSVWQLWWGYNNAAYVDVKRAVRGGGLLAGSDSFFLGRSPDLARERLVPSREAIEEHVVPALLRVLAEESDADMVTGALVALAKIGEDPDRETSAAEHIAAFLADHNQEISETAAVSLGILADRGSVGTLTGLLLDHAEARELLHRSEVPWRTRAFAAYGLGLIGNRVEDDEPLRAAIVGTLTGALTSGALELATPDVAVACVSALGLVPLSTDLATLSATGGGRMQQVRWLLAFEERADLSDVVRAHVPTALARLLEGTPSAWGLVPVVSSRWIELLSDRSDASRALQQSCVLALGRVGRPGDEATQRTVRAALERVGRTSRNVEVRRFALIALAQIGSRAGEGEVEQRVAAGIRAHLIGELAQGTGDVRAWAALALGVLGRNRAEEATEVEARTDQLLITALAEAKSPRDVGACAVACGLRRQAAASQALLRKLAEVRDDDVRGYLTLALGMAGAVEALEPIRELVRASQYRPELLRQAAIAMGLLGNKDIVPELVDMLGKASSLSAQASIAQGLGAIGDARSIPPLVRMLGDESRTPRARAFAAVALGIVSDRYAQPWNASLAIGVNYRANTATLTDGQGAGILEIL